LLGVGGAGVRRGLVALSVGAGALVDTGSGGSTLPPQSSGGSEPFVGEMDVVLRGETSARVARVGGGPVGTGGNVRIGGAPLGLDLFVNEVVCVEKERGESVDVPAQARVCTLF
jgi:hypothetical protein